jgi:hypothetical protein
MQACHTCDAGMQRPGNPHVFIVVAEDDSASAILAQAQHAISQWVIRVCEVPCTNTANQQSRLS